MVDPTNILTARAIVFLAFQKFIESSSGELGKKFTARAVEKMDDLHKVIWEKLRGKPTAEAALTSIEAGSRAEVDQLVAYLQAAMNDDSRFANDIQLLAQEIYVGKIQDSSSMTQNLYDNATGWQNRVEGGAVYIGDLTIANAGNFANRTSTKAEQVLEETENKSEAKISKLLTSLFADDPQIRSEAALALGNIGDENAVPALSHVLTMDQSPEVRRNAAAALGMIGSQETEAKG